MANLRHIKVGDTLTLRDANERRNGGPKRVVVKRVGRENLYIDEHRSPFGRDDGRAKDQWRHAWLQTDEQRAEEDLRVATRRRLDARRIELRRGMGVSELPVALLVAIADAVDAFYATAPTTSEP